MATIFKFPDRAPQDLHAPTDDRLKARAQEPRHIEPPESVNHMVLTSSAMTVVAAMSFYASQGYDGGKKARQAMGAVQELLASKGIFFAPATEEVPA